MKKHIIRSFCLLLALAAALSALTSCGAQGEQALAALPELVARAEVLNEYIWGKGAPVEYYDPDNVHKTTSQYERVTDDAEYRTLAELTEAILQVYSTNYCENILEIVLGGSEDAFARYNEDSADGRLTRDVTTEGYTLRTKIDASAARVVSEGWGRVKIAAPCTFDGQPDGDYEITLVLENGAWKLDSPTY